MKFLSRFFCLITTLFFISMTAQATSDLTDLKSGVMLNQPKSLKTFTLMDAQGKPFTNDNLKGKYTLIYFGFTNCPMMCPTSMAELATAYNTLEKNHIQPLPQVVFVSVDPERDTTAKVKHFVTTFNKNFLGVRTDDMAMLQSMTDDMKVMFTKTKAGVTQDRDPHATYTIDHSGGIMVINPDGNLQAIITWPHSAKSIVEDYQTVLAAKNK